MKKVLSLVILLSAVFSIKVAAQDATLFPKGEISVTNNHTGTIWLTELNQPDSIFNFSLAQATYEPAAKLDWHIHPAGQYLLITEGSGYYQEKGKPGQVVHKVMLLNACLEYRTGTEQRRAAPLPTWL